MLPSLPAGIVMLLLSVTDTFSTSPATRLNGGIAVVPVAALLNDTLLPTTAPL